MINASSLTDEQIKQMLIERGLRKAEDASPPQPQLTDEQIRQMMQARGLTAPIPSPGAAVTRYARQQLQAPQIGRQEIGEVGREFRAQPRQALINLLSQTLRTGAELPGAIGAAGQYVGIPGAQYLAQLPQEVTLPGARPEATPLVSQIPGKAAELATLVGLPEMGAAGVGLGARAGRGLTELLSPVTGRNAKETAMNFYNTLVRGRTKENLHTILNDKIKKLFENSKSSDNVNYDYVKRLAAQRGYTENAYTNPITGIPKGFPIDDYTSRNLLKEISPTHSETKKSLEKFLINKSYPNAHDLQSKLFKEASNLKHSANPLDTSKATRMFETRQALKDDIYNTFQSSGNGELSQALQNASDFHRTQVVPFTEKKMLADMLYKRKGMLHNPEGIFNYLKKEEENTQFIKNKLSPEDRDLFVAHGIRPAFVGIRKATKIKPTRVINEFDKLEGKGLREFMQDEHYLARNKIENQYELSRLVRKYGTRAAELAGAAGIVGGVGRTAWETF